MKKEISSELFNDLYDCATLAVSKIKKLSEMTGDGDDAVTIMDIVEDIMTAELKRMDEIREKAINENHEVTV